MRTRLRIGLAIILSLSLLSCVEQGGLKAGTATGKSMLRLLPASSRAVFMVDVHRSLTAEAVQNALKDETMKKKYDEFVKAAGLDPMKDIYFLAVAVSRTQAGNDREGAAVINLRYNRDNLLARIKGLVKDLKEEVYNGVTIYKGPGPTAGRGKAPVGAFLDDSNIVLGQDESVRAVIDVYQKKADPVAKNPEMKKLLKAVNTAANFWGAVLIPQDVVKRAAEKNAMLKDLVGLTGVTLSLDYANKKLVAEIQGLGGTKEQNKSLADKLTGLKAMGSLAGAKEPVLAEILQAIEISSSADNVKVFVSISEELLEKARTMAQQKLGGFVQTSPQAPKEEVKGEKKAEAEIKK